MRRVAALCLAASVVATGCSGSSTAPSEAVSSLSISAPSVIYIGQTSAMTAAVTRADGSMHDVTALASWSSSMASVATVSSEGRVAGVAGGFASITVVYQGHSANASVQVFPAVINGAPSLSVVIDGKPFIPRRVMLTRQPQSGFGTVAGIDDGALSMIHINFPFAVGTYDLASTFANEDYVGSDGVWQSNSTNSGGSGTITIVNLTSNRVSGRFAAVMNPLGGKAGPTKEMANGVFDVIF